MKKKKGFDRLKNLPIKIRKEYPIHHLEGRYSWCPELNAVWDYFEKKYITGKEIRITILAGSDAAEHFREQIRNQWGSERGGRYRTIAVRVSDLEYWNGERYRKCSQEAKSPCLKGVKIIQAYQTIPKA
jgi:hypothetical protein